MCVSRWKIGPNTRCHCDSQQCPTGRASPAPDNIRLPGFALPASRKVVATETSPSPPWGSRRLSEEHRTWNSCTSGSHAFSFLTFAFCNLVVLASNSRCKRQLHKAARTEERKHTVVALRRSCSLTWRQSRALCTTSDTPKPSKIQDTGRSSSKVFIKTFRMDFTRSDYKNVNKHGGKHQTRGEHIWPDSWNRRSSNPFTEVVDSKSLFFLSN